MGRGISIYHMHLICDPNHTHIISAIENAAYKGIL